MTGGDLWRIEQRAASGDWLRLSLVSRVVRQEKGEQAHVSSQRVGDHSRNGKNFGGELARGFSPAGSEVPGAVSGADGRGGGRRGRVDQAGIERICDGAAGSGD